jgi:hypothetical protein
MPHDVLGDEVSDAPFQSRDPLGCERSAHEAPQPGVVGWVLHEHRMLLAAPPGQEPYLGGGHPDALRRPSGAASAAGVEQRLATVVVAGQVDGTVQRAAMDRRDLTETVVEGIRIGQ